MLPRGAAQGCCLLLIGARDTSPVCNVGSLADEGDRGWDGRFEAVWVQGGMGWGQQAVHWGNMWKQKTGEREMGGTQGVVFRQIRELIHSQWDSGTREGLECGRWWEGGRVGGCTQGWLAQSLPQALPHPGQSLTQPPAPRASLFLHWQYWLELLLHLGAAAHPPSPAPGVAGTTPPGAKLPALDGGCFPGCLHQTCSLLVSANRIDRPFATSTNPTAGLGKHISPPSCSSEAELANPFQRPGVRTRPRGRAAARAHSCRALPSPAAAGRWRRG